MTKEKVRIRLKAYDHRVLDQAASKIVDTVKRTGGVVSGPVPKSLGHGCGFPCRFFDPAGIARPRSMPKPHNIACGLLPHNRGARPM